MQIKARDNISTDIANTLRDMIFDRVLDDGQRINEVHLAARLGVSRTPLREALATLVAEGALYSIPRRGFFVRELTVEEFRDIHPMRALLDPEALRLSGIPGPESLAKLRGINAKMREAGTSKRRTSLDEAWHLELVKKCPNQVLLGLVKHFTGRFRRYGLAFLQSAEVLEAANREHDEILHSLEAGDLDGACDWLRRNLSSNRQPVIEWLENRHPGR